MAEQQASFNMLKDLCSSYPVLQSPDWTKPFLMDTDMSDFALRAVISQEFKDGRHLITFYSYTLLLAERNYNVHNKEMATIVYSFKCSHPYFLSTNTLSPSELIIKPLILLLTTENHGPIGQMDGISTGL
jgi:reverse transcriptase-like protein